MEETITHEECLKCATDLWNDDLVIHQDLLELQKDDDRYNSSGGASYLGKHTNRWFEHNSYRPQSQRKPISVSNYICNAWKHCFEFNERKMLSFPSRSLHKSCACAKGFSNSKAKIFLLMVVLLVGVFAASMSFNNRWENHAITANQLFNSSTLLKTNKIVEQIRKKHRSKVSRRSSFGNPFNPDMWDNRTVNMNKHFVILYWSKIRGHIARMQTEEEYRRNQHVWPYTHVGKDCPVSCELTNNRSRAKEADAFVVHSRLTDVWDFPPFEYLAPWILQNNENPVYTAALSDSKLMNKFNLLISYRLDSDFPSPIYPMPSLSKPIPFKDRLGDVLAVFSKCELVRTEYMRQLMNFINVHSYGACLKNKEGLIGLYGQANGKYVFKDYKLVLTRFYKFSLVFMNQDCDYFVDDRLYHALESGSVPVYMGTDKIDEFLPPNLRNAIIRVADFDSPESLANYLRFLSTNETAYNKYLQWKNEGIGDVSNSTIGRWWKMKYPLFCQVCMRLSQGHLHAGLDVDVCKPRTYQDWKLKPPYGVEVKLQHNEHGINELKSMNCMLGLKCMSYMVLCCLFITACCTIFKARKIVFARIS